MPKRIGPALRERAVRLVLEHRSEYPSNAKAIAAVARQEGVGVESLRRWVARAEMNLGRFRLTVRTVSRSPAMTEVQPTPTTFT